MVIRHRITLLFAAAIAALSPAMAWAGAAGREANLELARQLNSAFVQVAEEVSPVVVVINVVQRATPYSALDLPDGLDNGGDSQDRIPPDLRRWFRQQEQTPREPVRGQGSGVIIRKDGFILTNRHVVEDAEKIEVTLKDGRIYPAKVRGVDAPSDVAVIKIEAQNLPVATLADSSKTRVGEFAIAIGAPFALDYSVTFGHVSAKDRSNIMPNDGEGPLALTDQSFIQTDANINPGNSGGPLVNIEGEVIGINTLIRGLRSGIGFAIPSNLAREVSDQLIASGRFNRTWLGIKISAMRDYPEFRDLVPGAPDGLIVTDITADGPVAKSGLRAGDVITTVEGKPVVTAQQLKDEIRVKKAGQNVTLGVFRRGKQINVVVKPGEWRDTTLAAIAKPAAPGDNAPAATLGVGVEELTRERAKQFGVEMSEGVIVVRVEPGSLGDHAIRRGDIINSINQQPVTTVKQFKDALQAVDIKKGVIISLVSQGEAHIQFLKETTDK